MILRILFKTFFMRTIFKVLIEYVIILLLFYILVLWPWGHRGRQLPDQGPNPHPLH